jgi:hypothetical protein
MNIDELLTEKCPPPAPRPARLSRIEKATIVAFRLWMMEPGTPIKTKMLFQPGEPTGAFNSWGDAAGAGDGGLGLEFDLQRRILRTRPNYLRAAYALKRVGIASSGVAGFLGLSVGADLVGELRTRSKSQMALLAEPEPEPAPEVEPETVEGELIEESESK